MFTAYGRVSLQTFTESQIPETVEFLNLVSVYSFKLISVHLKHLTLLLTRLKKTIFCFSIFRFFWLKLIFSYINLFSSWKNLINIHNPLLGKDKILCNILCFVLLCIGKIYNAYNTHSLYGLNIYRNNIRKYIILFFLYVYNIWIHIMMGSLHIVGWINGHNQKASNSIRINEL